MGGEFPGEVRRELFGELLVDVEAVRLDGGPRGAPLERGAASQRDSLTAVCSISSMYASGYLRMQGA